MKIKLFYHGNCPDGFGSAWAFYQKYKDSIDYEKFFYGKKINASKHDLIYFADCSVPLSKLNELRESCDVIIIDHHKTAIDELKDDPDFYYNINHSGCVLSWKFLFPNKPIPTLLKYIEDRDLWNWNLKNSQEILSYLDSFDFCFDAWSEINNDLSDQIGTNRIVEIGSSILRYKEKLVKIFSRNTNEIKIRGYNGSIINAPFFQGEIADCFEDKDFVIVFYKLKSHYKCSIRTRQDNVDVSLIAKHFGGGGHKKAAGFLIEDLSELNNI